MQASRHQDIKSTSSSQSGLKDRCDDPVKMSLLAITENRALVPWCLGGLKTFFLCVVLLSITGCDGVKKEMGLDRRSPDEFMVMKRAPLEIPDTLPTAVSQLPEPQPGLQRPQETAAKSQAKVAIIGSEKGTTAQAQSTAEQKLLQKAGAGQAPSNIRRLVNDEAKKQDDSQRPVLKKLLSIGDDVPAATVVDPVEEAKRLKKNKEEGKPVTAGETPTIKE